MNELHDRIVFITGASSGIGEATARLFASHGARLVLTARRLERVEELAARLRTEHGIDILVDRLDVRYRADVERFVAALPAAWEAVDVLINNAGLSRGLDKIHQGQVEDWEEMLDTNVKGLLYVSRAILPGMVARGSGHVVNLGSIAGREVYPNGNVYCASKFAERAITTGMRIDLNATGVRVSTIDPGMVETEFSLVRFHGDAERAGRVYADTRPLSAADVAEAIYWCVSRPSHVNVAEMVLLPSAQASATVVHRGPELTRP